MNNDTTEIDNAYVFMNFSDVNHSIALMMSGFARLDLLPLQSDPEAVKKRTLERNKVALDAFDAYSFNVKAVPFKYAAGVVAAEDKCILGVLTDRSSNGKFEKAPYTDENPKNKWNMEQAREAITRLNSDNSRAA